MYERLDVEDVGSASIILRAQIITREGANSSMLPVFYPYTQGGRRAGEWPCGASYTRLVVRRRGESCNRRKGDSQSESKYYRIAQPIFSLSSKIGVGQLRRGV